MIRRLRQDWESASRELGKLKDRHMEQAVKYSRALEEQGKASARERELLGQVGQQGCGAVVDALCDAQRKRKNAVRCGWLREKDVFCLTARRGSKLLRLQQ